MLTITGYHWAWNRNHGHAAVALCADQTSMIDDFPPHEWHGAGACAKWFSDFEAMAKTAGISRSVIVVGSPSHVEMSPHLAYVVAPATLSFERNGKSTKDKGLLTVTLRKGASDWRLTGWVWSDE